MSSGAPKTPIASQVINARRTESLDAPAILDLVQDQTKQTFGLVNVVDLIEKAILAVTLSNEHDEVLGHAAFFDYPNVPGLDQADWEEWLNTYYSAKKATPLNTLFMHYFVAKNEYSHGAAGEIIRTMFNAVPEAHFCFLCIPTGIYPESALDELFKSLERLPDVAGPDGCSVFVCNRHEHVPVLHIRHAGVEDHDDLTPIFNRQSDMLQMTYGKFFLAELIEAQDKNMHCLVAEVEGTAVGLMSISNDVNTHLLNECFELMPFHGLHKKHPSDQDVTELLRKCRGLPTPEPVVEEVLREPSVHEDVPPSESELAGQESVVTPSEDAEKKSVQATDKMDESVTGTVVEIESTVVDSETKVKPKLSEARMGDSTSSLHSVVSAPESAKSRVKSGGSTRQSSAKSAKESSFVGQVSSPSTQQPAVAVTSATKRSRPEYHGTGNAFCIQLFIIDERYEMRSLDFMAKAFDLFPNHDFAVITVPHLVPEFPLLQKFMRVTPRCPSILNQELYLYSRASLIKDFKVRPAVTADYSQIVKLVATLDCPNVLDDVKQFNQARRDDDGTEIQAFVCECQKQIVGIAIIRREEDIEYIRSHYNIEDFIYYNHHRRDEHGHVHHFAINPAFAQHSKFFLKEILRLGHKTCLYYPIYPTFADQEVTKQHSLVSAMNDLVPVRARRQIVYPLDTLKDNSPSDRVLQQKEQYSLCHLNRKLTLEPKVVINARIVVVGASDTGISLLETLAFCPHLRFNNLTLISPHGLPGAVLPPNELRENFKASSMCYNQDEYTQAALSCWVNVVFGKMTAIDRKKKNVVVDGQTLVPYDHLVLCTGEQYQVPAPTEADINKLMTTSEAPNNPDNWFRGKKPKNVFVVNDSIDAQVAMDHVTGDISDKGNVVIYGNTLDAYCCIQSLITLGIAGNRIQLVNPPLTGQTCFNNSQVDEAVCKTALQEEGVQVYSGYVLAQWNDGKGGEMVSVASFTSNTKPIRLECEVFFGYYKKKVDYEAFRAVNDACLVYDGKLVIDAAFHTNDVSVRAAGPLTKFQRRYHADQWTHSNFNSKEVGMSLANNLLTLFDPTLEMEGGPQADNLNLIPMYKSPKIQAAHLPGCFYYLHVSKPGLTLPLETQKGQNDYGTEIITGTPGGTPEYFRLHINQYQTIETVTCLSKKTIDSANLVHLYGLHERYLNNMVSRYQEGLFKDLFSYFKESWALAIFHDRFQDFRDEIRELLVTRPSTDVESLEEKVRTLIEEDLQLNKNQRKNLQDSFTEDGLRRVVDTRVLSFLSYNYYHLPMYAKPGMV